MQVKICGIKSADIALQAVEEGADALGFVFTPSKRQITPEQAREITRELPDHIWKVGVFVNQSPEEVRMIAETAGLTHIQLHGEENVDLYRGIGKHLIKSVNVQSEEDLNGLERFEADYILLDGPSVQLKGGNGKSFDWNLAARLEKSENIILAGGLSPENVKQAIEVVRPTMVDVSSGVETDGDKDLNKIRAFLEAAKGY